MKHIGYVLVATFLSSACRLIAPEEAPLRPPEPQPAAARVAALTPAVPTTPVSEVEAQVMRIYEEAGPGVVNITSRSLSYDYFMNAIPQEGSGSGFVYDQAGHVVTNFHVIEGAQELDVTLSNGDVVQARVVGADPSNDLAVLRLGDTSSALRPIPLGDSRTLRVGRFVVAIGNPFGLGGSLTMGVVSSLGRVIESRDNRFIGEIIQTDAPINPGNSGGPLLDLEGHVVGVNTAIFSPSGASAGIGFAIPASTVDRVVPELIARGRYRHPWLGVQTLDVAPAFAAILARNNERVPKEGGLMVYRTVSGGPADEAGIRGAQRTLRFRRYGDVPVGGDFITAIGGERVTDQKTLNIVLDTRTRVGDRVSVSLVRDGREMTVNAVLGERPEQAR